MKTLVVVAHPIEDSFNHGLTKTLVESLEERKQEVILRDLYSLNFNAILDAKEMEEIRQGEIREDVKKEQEFIKDCENLIFIFPLWWTSMPAILKGYIDRVFAYGFAYAYVDGEIKGLLGGKNVTIIHTQGSPNEYYDQLGMTEALKKTIDHGVFEFCDIEVKDHIILGGIPDVDMEQGKKIIDDVVAKI